MNGSGRTSDTLDIGRIEDIAPRLSWHTPRPDETADEHLATIYAIEAFRRAYRGHDLKPGRNLDAPQFNGLGGGGFDGAA